MIRSGRVPHLVAAALFAVALVLPLTARADDAAAAGAAVFEKSKCVLCHGKDGSADTPAGKSLKARDLRSAEVQKVPDAELAKVISDGRNKMPSFKSALSPDDIQHVIAFIHTLKK